MKYILIAIAATVLAGCAVSPKLSKGAQSHVERYTDKP